MDEKFLEVADALTHAMTERAIKVCQQKETRPENFEGSCECGDEVPAARVALGYYRCVRCQSHLEGRRRLFR